MEECVIAENDGELHIVDMIKDDCNICEEVAEKDLLERTIIKFKHLSPLEQQTLVSYFGLCGKLDGDCNNFSHRAPIEKIQKVFFVC